MEFIASRAADLLAIYATLPDYLLSWRLYSVLVLCLPLETVFVVRKRAILSVGLLQDFVVRAAKRWFFIPWLLLYTAFYKAFYEAAFPFLRWGIAETWHPALQFVAGFLAADFLFYCTHALKHRVTWIWRFRIHHSIEPRHRDKNFGERLVIWDWMFGTMYPHSDEYPETGLADAAYPLEASARGVSLFTQLWQQYVYPFRRILGSAGAR